MTEEQMRDEEVPTFDTIEELSAYIQRMADYPQHDYGTCVYAMSMSATAAFNFIARKLGVTGFQASCADLDIIKRVRHLKCPFTIITADNELYPQTNVVEKLQESRQSWRKWVVDQAKQKLKEEESSSFKANEFVRKHWEMLASEDL